MAAIRARPPTPAPLPTMGEGRRLGSRWPAAPDGHGLRAQSLRRGYLGTDERRGRSLAPPLSVERCPGVGQVHDAPGDPRLVQRKGADAGLPRVEDRDGQAVAFPAQPGGDVAAHEPAGGVMRALHGRALGVVVVGEAAAVAGGDAQEAADEIAFGHAVPAHQAEAAVFVGDVEVGVEGEAGTGFVFQERGLEIQDVAVRGEGVVGRFPDGFLDVEDPGLGVGGRRVLRNEGSPAAEAGGAGGREPVTMF